MPLLRGKHLINEYYFTLFNINHCNFDASGNSEPDYFMKGSWDSEISSSKLKFKRFAEQLYLEPATLPFIKIAVEVENKGTAILGINGRME